MSACTNRGTCFTERVCDPNIAIRVNIDPMRPDEHPAAKAFGNGTVWCKLDDRIEIRIKAFIAESVRSGITSDNRPEMFSIRIDGYATYSAHRPVGG